MLDLDVSGHYKPAALWARRAQGFSYPFFILVLNGVCSWIGSVLLGSVLLLSEANFKCCKQTATVHADFHVWPTPWCKLCCHGENCELTGQMIVTACCFASACIDPMHEVVHVIAEEKCVQLLIGFCII